jgi:hypothetical protein
MKTCALSRRRERMAINETGRGDIYTPTNSISMGSVLAAQVLCGLLARLPLRCTHRLLIMFASEQSEVFQLTSIQSFSGF